MKSIDTIAHMLKALGHPLRIQALEIMEQGERSVGELMEKLGTDQAILSQHLRIMREAGLVKVRRAGTLRFYGLADERLRALLHCIRQCRTKGVCS